MQPNKHVEVKEKKTGQTKKQARNLLCYYMRLFQWWLLWKVRVDDHRISLAVTCMWHLLDLAVLLAGGSLLLCGTELLKNPLTVVFVLARSLPSPNFFLCSFSWILFSTLLHVIFGLLGRYYLTFPGAANTFFFFLDLWERGKRINLYKAGE